jgi:hypothetical protein
MVIRYAVETGSPLVRNFASKEPNKLLGTKNIVGDNEIFQLITATPLYFDVKVPRPFSRATVKLVYQNPDQQPLIQLGAKQPNGGYYFSDMAHTSNLLDNLPYYWDKHREGEVVLWQKDKEQYERTFLPLKSALEKEKKEELDALSDQSRHGTITSEEVAEQKKSIEEKYNGKLKLALLGDGTNQGFTKKLLSIESFFDDYPEGSSILEYNMDGLYLLKIPGYVSKTEKTQVTTVLRGKHEILTYIGTGEKLDYTFTTQEINRHEGDDSVSISVYGPDGREVKRTLVADDGELRATGRVMPSVSTHIIAEGLSEGVYRIVIDTHDDTFIKNISTSQHLLVFKGNLYLAESEEYRSIIGDKKTSPVTVYASGSILRARTSHTSGLQNLKTRGRDVLIRELNTLVEMQIAEELESIVVPKADLYVEGDGYFAFDRGHFFDASKGYVANVTSVTDVDEYDYIIARYSEAVVSGEWLVAQATVEPPFLYTRKDGNYEVSLMINLPGLPEHDRTLKVKELEIIFEKEPITLDNFSDKLGNLFQKIKKNVKH